MTNRDKIANFLKGKNWVQAREMQKIFFYTMNPDTLTRECRRMREDNMIEKNPSNKFNEYRLITGGQMKIC